jgi:DNA-binding transcriptional LysR family regulator
MDLRHLRHALALAEARNFQRAADSMHISQSALSRSIQALERSLGAQLFDRGAKDVEPTELGRLLLEHAAHVEGAARDLRRELALAQGLESGELSVGAGPYAGAALLGVVAARLSHRHPKLHLKLVIAPWDELHGRLLSRDIDLMVADLRSIRALDEFETRDLAPHPARVMCRADHPLTELQAPTIADMLRFPVAGPTMTEDDIDGVLRLIAAPERRRLRQRGILTTVCDSAPVLKTMVQHSETLALLYLFLVEEELRRGRIRALPGIEIKPGPSLGVARLRNRTLSRPAAAFLDALYEYDRELVELDAELLATLSPGGSNPTTNRATPKSIRQNR